MVSADLYFPLGVGGALVARVPLPFFLDLAVAFCGVGAGISA